jgi:hypothetical protein
MGRRKEKAEVRSLIEASLRKQGFRIRNGEVALPKQFDKDGARDLHNLSVSHRVAAAKPHLARHEDKLIQRIASGSEIDPHSMAPRLVEVQRGSDDELLFRYASLHWSIPTSSGYGRRLRFLVEDASNGKLIGLFGLCDPVFSVAARDAWIGWDFHSRRKRLRNVLEAFILGAVPPYSMLLAGKLVAMLCTSDEVRAAFRRKYGSGASVINHAEADGRLAMIATTSALGRSSIYNRVAFGNRKLLLPVGYTSGWGEFHFSNGAYSRIREYAEAHCEQTAKNKSWGEGFRNRREVVQRVLSDIGLSDRWMNHGIRRELFVMPLAKNAREFLRGERTRLRWYHQSSETLAAYFRERWLLPRASRRRDYMEYSRDSFRLWRSGKESCRGSE